jgi:hypothetical protein
MTLSQLYFWASRRRDGSITPPRRRSTYINKQIFKRFHNQRIDDDGWRRLRKYPVNGHQNVMDPQHCWKCSITTAEAGTETTYAIVYPLLAQVQEFFESGFNHVSTIIFSTDEYR